MDKGRVEREIGKKERKARHALYKGKRVRKGLWE